MSSPSPHAAREVRIPTGSSVLDGTLTIPRRAVGIVLFAHGSGSSRFSPRNQAVAQTLNKEGIATLLFDLLTVEEEAADEDRRALRFDVGLLAQRLEDATYWLESVPDARRLSVGYFGASTGAAAAIVAAARVRTQVSAVVSRGGRPDLAGDALDSLRAPILLLVGSKDTDVLVFNEQALQRLDGAKELKIIPEASHLFEEPGTMEEVAHLAVQWFKRYFAPVPASARSAT